MDARSASGIHRGGPRVVAPAIVDDGPPWRERAARTSRDVVAWTLFGAVSALAALSCIVFNPRDGGVVGVVLILAIYGVALAALLWAAFETRGPRRSGAEDGRVPVGPQHDE